MPVQESNHEQPDPGAYFEKSDTLGKDVDCERALDKYCENIMNADISALRFACDFRGLASNGHRILLVDRIKKYLYSNYKQKQQADSFNDKDTQQQKRDIEHDIGTLKESKIDSGESFALVSSIHTSAREVDPFFQSIKNDSDLTMRNLQVPAAPVILAESGTEDSPKSSQSKDTVFSDRQGSIMKLKQKEQLFQAPTSRLGWQQDIEDGHIGEVHMQNLIDKHAMCGQPVNPDIFIHDILLFHGYAFANASNHMWYGPSVKICDFPNHLLFVRMFVKENTVTCITEEHVHAEHISRSRSVLDRGLKRYDSEEAVQAFLEEHNAGTAKSSGIEAGFLGIAATNVDDSVSSDQPEPVLLV